MRLRMGLWLGVVGALIGTGIAFWMLRPRWACPVGTLDCAPPPTFGGPQFMALAVGVTVAVALALVAGGLQGRD